MRYIASLELEDFQCHARTRLDFSPGLNVIVGPSDQGKTAIIRALRWVLYNEPRGADFVRAGAESCRVTVTLDDGTRITREKGGRINRYILERDGQQQVWNAVGSDVPPEVLAAHGMSKLHLDADTEVLLNVGGQLEGPFLLESPGSMRAKAIGQVIGAHILDAAVRETVADEGRAAREAGVLREELARKEGELAAFADLPAQEKALERAEGMLARAQELRHRVDRLLACKERLGRTRQEAQRLGEVTRRLAHLPRAEVMLREAEALAGRYIRLRRLADRWSENAARCRYWGQVMDAIGDLTRAERALGEATGLVARWGRLRELGARLARKGEQMAAVRRERDQAGARERQLRAQYAQLLTRLGRCPTCGAPVGPECMEGILAQIFGEGETG